MQARIALFALALAFIASPCATAEPDDALHLDRVPWLAVPDGAAFAQNYPRRALAENTGGRAVLDCAIGEDGRLDCTVVSEAPADFGFGEAALALSPAFRAAPQTEDGVATAGRRVRVPIRFELAASSPSTQSMTLPRGADLYWETGMITRFYPPAAREAGLEGRVLLDCVINAELRYDCAIASEDPTGHGFGDAALQIMDEFYLRLGPGEASPIGRRSRERIHFRAHR